MSNIFICLTASLAAVTAVATAGCAESDPTPVNDSQLFDDLRLEPSFEIGHSTGTIIADAAALRRDLETSIDFAVEGGEISIAASSGGLLSLVDFSIALGDVTVPADILPPRGLELTDISVRLGQLVTVEADWDVDGEGVTADVTVDLVLSWATRRDGRTVPLGDINVTDVPLTVTAERDGHSAAVSISAHRDGAFWTWARTFELRNLSVFVDAQ